MVRLNSGKFLNIQVLISCLWSSPCKTRFHPNTRDVLGHYTHPFPSRDGNKRSFICTTEPRRIPQNGVAPFRMESQSEVEVNWSVMSSQAIVAFIGKNDVNTLLLTNKIIQRACFIFTKTCVSLVHISWQVDWSTENQKIAICRPQFHPLR